MHSLLFNIQTPADYMVAKLGIPQDQVQQLTQELYLAHGTTMAGLTARGYSIDFDDWHVHVHGSLDYQRLLHSQPATRQALQEMCVQQHILTNADAKHTAACLTQMGLTGCFQVGIVCWRLAHQQGALLGDDGQGTKYAGGCRISHRVHDTDCALGLHVGVHELHWQLQSSFTAALTRAIDLVCSHVTYAAAHPHLCGCPALPSEHLVL